MLCRSLEAVSGPTRLRIISQLDFHDRPVRIVQKNPVPHVKQFGAEKGGSDLCGYMAVCISIDGL